MIESLYIHIPFCDKICTYCDFSKVLSDAFDHRKYLEALIEEYRLYKEKYKQLAFNTIYFGGGTPSSLSSESLIFLFEAFKEELALASEVTFEANPESLTAAKIAILAKYGINRVSMGVQTFDQKQLRFLGRHHTTADVKAAVSSLNKVGITNYNIDLIYALPHQTLAMFQQDVEALLALNPTHISSYALIVEEHTKLYLDIENDKYTEVDESVQQEMYQFLQKRLAEQGFKHYEVSNWSKNEQTQSKHNMTYWSMTPYLALGLGAHGYTDEIRYANTKSITKYVESLTKNKKLPVIYTHEVTRIEAMEETVFLGLRKIAGVDIKQFEAKFGESIFTIFSDPLQKHLQSGMLILEDNMLKLAPAAIFTSNDILSDFLLEAL